MQSNLNREAIRKHAGAFNEADAFRVIRRRECKARKLARGARRALKAAAIAAAMFAGAANAADRAPLPSIALNALTRDAAAGSSQAFCGRMWKEEKRTLAPAGYDWPAYLSACVNVLKGRPGIPTEKAAAANAARAAAKAGRAICSTDSDCERVTGRPVSLAPVTAAD